MGARGMNCETVLLDNDRRQARDVSSFTHKIG